MVETLTNPTNLLTIFVAVVVIPSFAAATS